MIVHQFFGCIRFLCDLLEKDCSMWWSVSKSLVSTYLADPFSIRTEKNVDLCLGNLLVFSPSFRQQCKLYSLCLKVFFGVV